MSDNLFDYGADLFTVKDKDYDEDLFSSSDDLFAPKISESQDKKDLFAIENTEYGEDLFAIEQKEYSDDLFAIENKGYDEDLFAVENIEYDEDLSTSEILIEKEIQSESIVSKSIGEIAELESVNPESAIIKNEEFKVKESNPIETKSENSSPKLDLSTPDVDLDDFWNTKTEESSFEDFWTFTPDRKPIEKVEHEVTELEFSGGIIGLLCSFLMLILFFVIMFLNSREQTYASTISLDAFYMISPVALVINGVSFKSLTGKIGGLLFIGVIVLQLIQGGIS